MLAGIYDHHLRSTETIWSEGGHTVLQNRYELEKMMQLFETTPVKRVLEIGVGDGGTLWRWLRHGQGDVQITAVDINSLRSGLEHPRVTFFQGNSTAPSMIERVRKCGPFQWLFIDGGHDYEVVRQDFENYGPMVEKPGVIALHDIRHPAYGVYRLWDEIRAAGYLVREIVGNGEPPCGIGVVYV